MTDEITTGELAKLFDTTPKTLPTLASAASSRRDRIAALGRSMPL
jgi:hypothetical protein